MNRPTTKDKKADEYIDFLEAQLQNFNADTTNVRLYLGVKKNIDDMAALLAKGEIEVPDPRDADKTIKVPIMSIEALSSKDDKFFDRFTKIMDKFLEYSDNLSKAAERINPVILTAAEKEANKETGSIYERIAMDDAN